MRFLANVLAYKGIIDDFQLFHHSRRTLSAPIRQKVFRYSVGVCPVYCRNTSENLLAFWYPTLPAISVTSSFVSRRNPAAVWMR